MPGLQRRGRGTLRARPAPFRLFVFATLVSAFRPICAFLCFPASIVNQFSQSAVSSNIGRIGRLIAPSALRSTVSTGISTARLTSRAMTMQVNNEEKPNAQRKRKASAPLEVPEGAESLPDGKISSEGTSISVLGPQRKRRQALKAKEGSADPVDEPMKPSNPRTNQRAKKVKSEVDIKTSELQQEEKIPTIQIKKEDHDVVNQIKLEVDAKLIATKQENECKDNIKPSVSDESTNQESKADATSSPEKKSRKRVPIQPGSLKPPKGWKEIYDLVVELRKERDFPVDWAGSEALGYNEETGLVDEFHALVALMLSSQTKDQVVAEAMTTLKKRGLTVDSVLEMSDKELDSMISKVGFHNNKTKFIKQAAAILKEKHGGKVPRTLDELCELPGVGPKMALITLKAAFGIIAGIGVDTHMHRMFNELKWVVSSTPEKTREQLEGWLPFEEWGNINVLFVGLGQGIQQPAERLKLIRRCIDCSKPVEALKLVKFLGADVKGTVDKETGESALLYACRQGRLEAVQQLMKMGSKLNVRNANGESAMEVVRKYQHQALIEFLETQQKGKKA